MRKSLLLLSSLLLFAGCAKYEPIVDLKATKNPQLFQEDWMECEWLKNKYDLDHEAETKCLQGRGASIIGEHKL